MKATQLHEGQEEIRVAKNKNQSAIPVSLGMSFEFTGSCIERLLNYSGFSAQCLRLEA